MAKTILYVLGGILIVVGILGYFNDPVLGIFEVDGLHNIVHIVTGLILVGLAAMGGQQAVMGTKVLGVIYAVIAVLGFVMGGDSLFGLIEINSADHILHALLALILLYVGFAPNMRSVEERMSGGAPHMGGNSGM